MAIIRELDQEAWQKWVATRPDDIQQMCHAFPPDRIYLLKTSNHRVEIESYCEDGTVTVSVTGKYNKIAFDREVFGVNLDGLEECELPPEGEELGAALTNTTHINEFIDIIRPAILANRA